MSRPRYPSLKRDANGAIVCRCGCGKPIPKGRETWASRACYQRRCPAIVNAAVWKRAGGKCELCAFDIAAAKAARMRKYLAARLQTWSEQQAWKKAHPVPDQYDHILPHSEGGEHTVENIRCLCRGCHLAVTREWRRAKAAKKKQEGMLL